jgi:Fur family ferric uptake transcriptional regulator
MNQDAAYETLGKYLKSKGKLRATPERYAILDAVLQTQGHFDAEGLYYRLISSGMKVSKATVYNTLDLLLNAGLVSKYRFTENSSRYEKAFGRPHHHHLICLECGDIIEFVNDRLERIQEEVCAEKKFQPQSSTLQIFGVCSKCKKDQT